MCSFWMKNFSLELAIDGSSVLNEIGCCVDVSGMERGKRHIHIEFFEFQWLRWKFFGIFLCSVWHQNPENYRYIIHWHTNMVLMDFFSRLYTSRVHRNGKITDTYNFSQLINSKHILSLPFVPCLVESLWNSFRIGEKDVWLMSLLDSGHSASGHHGTVTFCSMLRLNRANSNKHVSFMIFYWTVQNFCIGRCIASHF